MSLCEVQQGLRERIDQFIGWDLELAQNYNQTAITEDPNAIKRMGKINN